LAVAAINKNTADFYKEQIRRLFQEGIEVQAYCFEDRSIEKGIIADLVLISTYSIFEAVKRHVKSRCEIIKANRTISKKGFDKILSLPKGTKAMLVNVGPRMAVETISLIYQLGAKHIELIPVYPDMGDIPNIDIAITPGEIKYVPDSAREIIDIGERVLDISSIMDISVRLNLDSLLKGYTIKKYFNEIIPISFGTQKIIGKNIKLESQLDSLFKTLNEGVIGINPRGIIYSYSLSARKILKYKVGDVVGKYASEVFPEIPFEFVLETLESVEDKLVRINNCDIVVTVVPIIDNNELYGAFAIVKRFSDVEKKQHKLRAQLIGKGHRAKYYFKDIIGNSIKINKCKDIAKRMAGSESSVLILGESGTGKELFAQAIHNNSNRKNYQFVAVNCAALPENLLESELFGYEEGAFTGARRGGKPGLFELAHMGTLFLDEIGEMPIKLQARLLRVLQEREVMRIGGDSVINVDVRIIAATNRDLEELVRKGQFRKDLYFRINVLPLRIPLLRERIEDIPLIITELKRELGAKFELTAAAKEKLLTHRWEGNVRELRNYLEYFANLGQDIVDVDDMPFLSQKDIYYNALNEYDKELMEKFKRRIGNQFPKYMRVLEILENKYRKKERIGRKGISKIINEDGVFITEQEVRGILINLENYSMVNIHKGRAGTEITEFGIQAINFLKMG
jgi:transcriptional regulator with PAS, ATPase and Fis domain